MNFLFAKQADGIRVSFAVSKSGVLSTGLVAGDFTATVVDDDDSASATYTVSESAQKPGLYYFDVPSSFLATNGLGDYSLVVEVSATTPKIDAVASGVMKVAREDLDALAELMFDGAVNIDTKNGVAGTAYPIGTVSTPVSNLADALTIDGVQSFGRFRVRGNLTLTTAVDDTVWEGRGEEAEINLAGQDAADSEFKGLKISGTLGNGPINAIECELNGVSGLYGTMRECILSGAVIDMGGNLRLVRPYSGVAGSATPAISMGAGNAYDLHVRGHVGGLEVRNVTAAGANVSLDGNPAHFRIDASCTSGDWALRGVGKLTNNSTVPDGQLDREGWLNKWEIWHGLELP